MINYSSSNSRSKCDRGFVVNTMLQDRFGDELGEEVWEGCNAVFDRLPLASVIDHDIFCVHGGIPRPLPESTSRVQVRWCVFVFVFVLVLAFVLNR